MSAFIDIDIIEQRIEQIMHRAGSAERQQLISVLFKAIGAAPT